MTVEARLGVRQVQFPSEALERLPDSSGLPAAAQRAQLRERHFVFLRGAIPAEQVAACRLALEAEGATHELAGHPAVAGLCGQGSALGRVVSGVLGEKSVAPVPAARTVRCYINDNCFTGVHCDSIYVGASGLIYTTWLPLMHLPVRRGGLAVLDKSTNRQVYETVQSGYGKLWPPQLGSPQLAGSTEVASGAQSKILSYDPWVVVG